MPSFPPPRSYDLHDPFTPNRLAAYAEDAETLFAVGEPLDDSRVIVAIVGARDAEPAPLAYARNLAAKLAARGALVASGGAKGIDAAAHEGAMEGGGPTLAVIPSGYPNASPPDHADLYQRIVERRGTLLWTLQPGVATHMAAFRMRNKLLVTLADVVVVVQAGLKSGSLITAGFARKSNKPLWIVPPAPWFPASAFEGNRVELGRPATATTARALPLMNDDDFFKALQLTAEKPAFEPVRSDADEVSILRVLRDSSARGEGPLHTDEIAQRSALSSQQVATALLTLSLEALVLEGPGGFYRRQAIARPKPGRPLASPPRQIPLR